MLILICFWRLTPLYCWNIAKEGTKQHIMKIIIVGVFFYFQGLIYRETTSERQSTIINKDYEEENTKEAGWVYFQILSTFSFSEFHCHLKCNLIFFQFQMFNIWSVYMEVCLALWIGRFRLVSLVYGVWRHFQRYFSYIVEASFICGGNRSMWRKPPTCRKSLTKLHNVVSSTPRHELPTSVVTGTDWLLM